jgi:hypothetical protein
MIKPHSFKNIFPFTLHTWRLESKVKSNDTRYEISSPLICTSRMEYLRYALFIIEDTRGGLFHILVKSSKYIMTIENRSRNARCALLCEYQS